MSLDLVSSIASVSKQLILHHAEVWITRLITIHWVLCDMLCYVEM
jgi:hypothetical protein